ncbi:hypothetical protein ACWJKU_08045 [Methylocaldum sp. MU1018]
MAAKTVERELSEQTLAALWKYVKYILRIHISGILDEAETNGRAGNIGTHST